MAAKKAKDATEGTEAAPKKTAAAKEAPPKANGLKKPVTPSKELAAIVGADPLTRAEVTSKVWEYIKANKLQDPKDGRRIEADDKLEKVFGTKSLTMFEMNKHVSKHLS